MPLFRKKKDPALTGTARLSSMEQTGQVSNQQSVWRIGLRVQVPGREPYDVTLQQPVDPMVTAAPQSGAAIPVQVDPADPQSVRIDFNQPISVGRAPTSMPQPDFAVRPESETERTRRSALTSEDVRNVAFSKPPIGKRGYNEDEVDAILDLVEEEMRRRATGTHT
jgi:DivIVA domain-containing protein